MTTDPGKERVRLEVELDDHEALHLLVALRRQRDYCEKSRESRFPDVLDVLRRDVELIARGLAPDISGQSAGPLATMKEPPGVVRSHDDTPFLTRREFAGAVGRNERTVRRWIASGKVVANLAGIPRTELDRLRKGRTNGTQSTRR